MKFTVEREHLLKPLQQVSGPLGGRPTLPILGNLLLQVADGTLSLTGTDLEMEMVARVALVQQHEPGATTVPARKFFDICRGLPEGAEIAVQLEGERMLVRSGRSRFSLSTLPAADFPNLDDWQSEVEFTLPQATMKRLIEATQFSMAHQDVRYYLNGMLFETEGEELRTVATDGHRLAVCSMPIGQSLPSHSVIVPRKGVIELMRMLDGGDTAARTDWQQQHSRPRWRLYLHLQTGGWSLPGLSPRSAEEPGQTSGSWLRSAQAGVCSRGDSL